MLLLLRCLIIISITIFSKISFADDNFENKEFFNLNDCVKIVLDNSDELAVADANIEKSTENYQFLKKDLYPTLSSSYAYLKKKPSLTVVENNYTYNVSIEQPLYRGGALTTAVALGSINLEFAKESYVEAKNNILLTVNKSYYELLKAQKIEEQADLSVKRLKSHLKDAMAFYEAGLIPKNDLLISEVELAQALQEQLMAKNTTSLAKSKLNILMKRNVDSELFIVDILETQTRQLNWDDEIGKAFKLRPELAKLKLSTQSAEKNIKISAASYLPSVTVSATYQKIGDNPLADSYPLGPSESQTAQAVASWNFWSWGQKDNQIASAKKDLIKAQRTLNQASDAIILQTREAFLNIIHAEKNIKVSRKAVTQAEENFRINQARYQAQLSTSTDVLDAQSLLSRANTNFFNSLYVYKIALASLDWATGSLASQFTPQKDN